MSGPSSLFSVVARGADRAPVQECPKCHKEFTLGVNGTVDGCDECNGVTRDLAGFAWDGCLCFDIVGDNYQCPHHGKGGNHA